MEGQRRKMQVAPPPWLIHMTDLTAEGTVFAQWGDSFRAVGGHPSRGGGTLFREDGVFVQLWVLWLLWLLVSILILLSCLLTSCTKMGGHALCPTVLLKPLELLGKV